MARGIAPRGNPPPMPRRQLQPIQMHILPFADHTGRPARMVFQGPRSSPLPPLYSFAIYFTHSDATPETVDAVGLMSAIWNQNEFLDFRLDLYFIPGGNEESCIAHYHGEKGARGTYIAQLTASESQGRLPGLVPSYSDLHQARVYHGLLYRCSEPSWSSDRGRLCSIEFDPVSQEEYESVMDEDDDPVPAPTTTEALAINEQSASYEMFSDTVQMQMYERSNLQRANVTTEPWQQAVQRGWTSW